MSESLKIVHCANFSFMKDGAVFYSIDRKISNGFILNGHFVYDFSYRDVSRCSSLIGRKLFGRKKMNEKLLKTVEKIKPDILFLGHSELVERKTLLKIKEKFPRIKIAMWWVDPVEEKKIKHIKERIDLLDAFFATTAVVELQKIFPKKRNIFYFPNICDSAIERFRGFENMNYRYDLLFAGSPDPQRNDFLQKVRTISEYKIKMLGYDSPKLFGFAYYEAIRDSKIALNYSRFNDVPLYSSDRIIQITANGAMAISPKIPMFEKIFSSNEIVYFEDFNELKDKVKYYILHDQERREIAYNGWKRAHESYNSKKVVQNMLQQMKGNNENIISTHRS